MSYRILGWEGGGGAATRSSTKHRSVWGHAPPALPDFLHPLRLILMKIAVEGPELSSVPFKEILDVFKEQNRCIEINLLVLL